MKDKEEKKERLSKVFNFTWNKIKDLTYCPCQSKESLDKLSEQINSQYYNLQIPADEKVVACQLFSAIVGYAALQVEENK